MTEPLSPEREQEWRDMARAAAAGPAGWPDSADRYFVTGGVHGVPELLDELDRLRASADTCEAYDGELATYRELVRTLRVIVRPDDATVDHVRQLLHQHAADDAAARAETKGEGSRTADATPEGAVRQATLLDAIRANPGGRWKSGRARRALADAGFEVSRGTAGQDLNRLADAGHLTRHDDKGVTWYTLGRPGGDR